MIDTIQPHHSNPATSMDFIERRTFFRLSLSPPARFIMRGFLGHSNGASSGALVNITPSWRFSILF